MYTNILAQVLSVLISTSNFESLVMYMRILKKYVLKYVFVITLSFCHHPFICMVWAFSFSSSCCNCWQRGSKGNVGSSTDGAGACWNGGSSRTVGAQ